MQGVNALCRMEGILPALESAHAIGWLLKAGPQLKKRDVVVVNVSGRGDKDVQQMEAWDHEHPPKGKRA
jgi:tryptophan synthase beta chain